MYVLGHKFVSGPSLKAPFNPCLAGRDKTSLSQKKTLLFRPMNINSIWFMVKVSPLSYQ